MTLRGDFPQPWPAGSWPAAQQGVCRQFCLSSCGQSTVLEKGTPTPGCHLHREAELVAPCSVTSSARMRGTGTGLLSLGGFMRLMVEHLSPWCCQPKSLGWAEAWLQAYHPLQHQGESYSLSCRKVCAPLMDVGKNNGKWGAVTLPQPPSYWENRIK